ncbi:MAG: O-antigen ligase family protein [Dokdonella sp.]|uniref:O-antigen ligase family protein n=1 Tax=Dokdonella sp. TaxID=2291710 RepID=UPI003F806F45
MLRFLLLFQILYTVYQGHYNFESGVPGLNLPNALFLLVLLMLHFSGKHDELDAKARMRGPLLFFMAMLVLAFAIAQMRAPGEFMVDLTYLKNALFSPLLYFMYLHCKQDLRNTRLLVIAVMAVAAVAAVQAIRQGFDYGIGAFVETHRASGPFGSNYRDANRAGVYYAMFLPMFIGLALFLEHKRWRIAALGGVVLLTMALLFTYSRQAYFIAVIGLVVLLLRRSVLLALVLGATLASLVGFLPESVTQRVEETQQKGPHGEEKVDESTASRWEIWAGALAMWQANPAGVGQNRFKNEIGHYSAFQHFDAHNFYVLTLAEGGPQALLALLLLVLATFRLGAWLRRSMPPDDAEARALAIGFSVTALAMALGNLYGSPFLEGNVMGTFWILCGLLERYMLLKTRQAPASTALVVAGTDHMVERFPLAARARGIPARRP